MATTIDLTHPKPLGESAPPAVPRGVWLGFLVVLASAVMDLLDSTIAQTAAPAIRAELGGSYASLEWISAGYTLALAVCLLLGGRLGDVFGRRRVLLVGMGGFVAASVLCALAPSMGALIAGRVLQGAVGAIMLPQGFGLIRELFGEAGQQKAFAIFGPVMGLAAVAGPIVGGGLVDLDLLGTSWRAIFLVNVPLGLGAIWLGLRHLPDTAPSAPGGKLDPVSAGLAAAGGFALVYPLVQGRELGWPAWCWALEVAGVATLAAFGWLQRRRSAQGRTPLVELSVLEHRGYVSGLALVLAFIGAMGGMLLALTVMLQTGLGFSPLGSGVATMAIPLAAIGGSILSSVLVGRLGRITIQIGTATMALGLVVADLVLRHRGAAVSAWELSGPLVLTGLGMGMVFMPMFDIVLAGVRPEQIGSASGLLESVQQLAMSVGIAVVGTVLFDAVGASHAAADVVGATDQALLVAVGFLTVAFAVCFWLPRHAREEG